MAAMEAASGAAGRKLATPWKMLYAMTWLVVTQFLLGVAARSFGWVRYAHAALGLALVGLAFANWRALAATGAPGRVKRTSRSTIELAGGAAALGLLLLFDVGAGRAIVAGVTWWGALLVAHVFLAVGVLAESAAVGMAYDMWEEREFAAASPAS